MSLEPIDQGGQVGCRRRCHSRYGWQFRAHHHYFRPHWRTSDEASRCAEACHCVKVCHSAGKPSRKKRKAAPRLRDKNMQTRRW
eukprot:2557209-Prymnesium_polylepis.4